MISNDTLLLKKLSKGERSAYSELFDRYFERMQAFASTIVFRDDAAADIVQEVLIRLYEKPVTFTDMGSLQSYLFTAIRNRCYNYLRDLKVQDKHMLLYMQTASRPGNLDSAEQEDLLADINIDDVLMNVERIIELLPQRCRQICRMRLIERLKYADIAQQLNISENTAKVQIHRGMERIRKHFASGYLTLLLLVILGGL